MTISPAVQRQIDEHTMRARIDRRPVPPLFLVFESGDYVPAGRVLAATGDIVKIGTRRCIRLLLPVEEALRAVHPDSLTGNGRFVMIAQTTDGCAPVNEPALEIAASLRV